MTNKRKGKGYSWEDAQETCYGARSLRGFTVDNLDSKDISQAEDHYEEVFIRIREMLNDKPWCCDNKEDVLNICQTVSDNLRENLLIRKD